VPFVDVTGERNSASQNAFGGPDRSAQCNTQADVAEAGNAATTSSGDINVNSPTEHSLQSCD
jgi:hypothetical protein